MSYIYYAHSIVIYNTPREMAELSLLHETFDNVFNPNCPKIAQARNPMKACLKMIKDRECLGLAFSTNRFAVSFGVYREIQTAQKRKLPLYHVFSNGVDLFEGRFRVTKYDKKLNWAHVYASNHN